MLREVAQIIGATILNIAHQDYDPQGASVTMLISELPVQIPLQEEPMAAEMPGPLPEAVVAHLDKSHITVHTYPECHPDNGISTFRADIDVSTCGRVSPLRALNYLIHTFESDIVIIDYRVRGFTREKGITLHRPQDQLDSELRGQEHARPLPGHGRKCHQENIFHTKMMLKELTILTLRRHRRRPPAAGEEDVTQRCNARSWKSLTAPISRTTRSCASVISPHSFRSVGTIGLASAGRCRCYLWLENPLMYNHI